MKGSPEILLILHIKSFTSCLKQIEHRFSMLSFFISVLCFNLSLRISLFHEHGKGESLEYVIAVSVPGRHLCQYVKCVMNHTHSTETSLRGFTLNIQYKYQKVPNFIYKFSKYCIIWRLVQVIIKKSSHLGLNWLLRNCQLSLWKNIKLQ